MSEEYQPPAFICMECDHPCIIRTYTSVIPQVCPYGLGAVKWERYGCHEGGKDE